MYHLETTYSIQIWRDMSIWFENIFVVVHAYRLKNSLLGQIFREISILGRKHKFFWFKTRSSMYHLDTAQFIEIWREMSIWFENTFFVVQAYRLETSLLGQIWREISILGRNTQFYVSPRKYIFHPNLT